MLCRNVKNITFAVSQQTWAYNLALPLSAWEIEGRVFNLSELQFP